MKVLITRPVADPVEKLMKSWGWEYQMLETLGISSLKVDEVPSGADYWILSSRNSLHVVLNYLRHAPNKIYCIVGQCAQTLRQLAPEREVLSFENMKTLAQDLNSREFKQVVYFCGDHHRNELEVELAGQSGKISYCICYESKLLNPVVEGKFDAVFVFSPRSVESLLTHNRFETSTLFACIGQTTEKYCRQRGITQTFCASYPEAEVLMREFKLNHNL